MNREGKRRLMRLIDKANQKAKSKLSEGFCRHIALNVDKGVVSPQDVKIQFNNLDYKKIKRFSKTNVWEEVESVRQDSEEE